jgi:hypothetical protein
MQCQHARELFSDYVAEAIDSALAISLENHLTSCAACHEEVEGLRRVWAVLEQAPLVEAPAFFHENVMSRIDAARAEAEDAAARKRALWDWRALFRPRTLAFGAAAAILLLACVEVVQQARPAALGPLGVITGWLQHVPTVKLRVTDSTWTPQATGPVGSGTLTVRLHAEGVSAAGGNLNYRAQLEGVRNSLAVGMLTADGDTSLKFSLSETPASDGLHLSIQLMAPDGRAVESNSQLVLPHVPIVPSGGQDDVAPQSQNP